MWYRFVFCGCPLRSRLIILWVCLKNFLFSLENFLFLHQVHNRGLNGGWSVYEINYKNDKGLKEIKTSGLGQRTLSQYFTICGPGANQKPDFFTVEHFKGKQMADLFYFIFIIVNLSNLHWGNKTIGETHLSFPETLRWLVTLCVKTLQYGYRSTPLKFLLSAFIW